MSGIRNSVRRQIKLLLIFTKKYDNIFDVRSQKQEHSQKTLFLAPFRPLVSLPFCQTACFYTLGHLLHLANPGYLRSIGTEPGCRGSYLHGSRWFRSRVVHKFSGCFHRFKRWDWYDCWFSRFQYFICDWCVCFFCQLHWRLYNFWQNVFEFKLVSAISGHFVLCKTCCGGHLPFFSFLKHFLYNEIFE